MTDMFVEGMIIGLESSAVEMGTFSWNADGPGVRWYVARNRDVTLLLLDPDEVALKGLMLRLIARGWPPAVGGIDTLYYIREGVVMAAIAGTTISDEQLATLIGALRAEAG